MAFLYKTDGEIQEIFPKNNKFKLEELQRLVDGFIEIIKLPTDLHPDCVMIVNELGKSTQPKNEKASSLAKFDIFGDVILIAEGM